MMNTEDMHLSKILNDVDSVLQFVNLMIDKTCWRVSRNINATPCFEIGDKLRRNPNHHIPEVREKLSGEWVIWDLGREYQLVDPAGVVIASASNDKDHDADTAFQQLQVINNTWLMNFDIDKDTLSLKIFFDNGYIFRSSPYTSWKPEDDVSAWEIFSPVNRKALQVGPFGVNGSGGWRWEE